MRRFLVCLVLSVVAFRTHAQCGVERWSVKTGTDPDAPSVSLSTYISTTIYNMQSSTRPSSLPANNRVAPREMNQYRISGTLTKYKRETDSDYHLVIQDSAGRTMILEIPSTNCVGGGSPFGSGISHARSQFDARLTATTTMKSTSIPITVRGVGFWDFLHGQTGVAPNGIEIHPLLDITFNSAKTGDEDIYVPEAPMPPDMVADDDGGRVHVYRGGDAIANILFHGGPVIEQPRLHLIFAGERWDDASKRTALNIARTLGDNGRFDELTRYGVRTPAMPVDDARELGRENRAPRLLRRAGAIAGAPREMNDLDVQRLLAGAVENGQIQHVDENAVYVVLLDSDTNAKVGTASDWTSYHSLFHPTDLAMPYVVVRGGLDANGLRDAMYASVARAIVDPAGNGWF